MRAVVQRVLRASVTVEAAGHHADIGHGLCVLLGVMEGDTQREAAWIAAKLANLRIFPDDDDRMNRTVRDIGGAILLVSQFTLAGDCSRGNRPSFATAAHPAAAEPLYEQVGQLLETEHQLPVKYGQFGGLMQVELVNDGPVTLIIDRPPTVNDG